jgi:DNA primase
MGNKQTSNIDFNDPLLLTAIENWDMISFFDDYNVDYSLDGRNIGRNFIGVNPCPFCGDSRNHFAVHQDGKFGSCFICKGHAHPIKLISFFGRMTFKKAHSYLLSQTSDQMEMMDRVKSIFKHKVRKEGGQNRFYDPLPESRLITYQDLKNEHLKNFFKKRKLHRWHIPRYQLRLCLDSKFRGFILFPMLIDHRPVSYQLRHLIRRQYHNGTNLDKFVFNEENIIEGKPVILVEGFLDFVNVDSFIRCYYPGKISVVTGGLKSVSNAQLDRLRNHSPSQLIVMFDGDSWFDYYRIKNSIGYNVNYVILDKDKDPNDLSWEELNTLFKKEIKKCFTSQII